MDPQQKEQLAALVELVNRWAPGASLQEETQQVVSLIHTRSGDVPVFVRLQCEEELLQLLAFLPTDLIPDAIADTGRFLHLINKSLDRPGLGIDEAFRVIFYRNVLPMRDGQVDCEGLRKAWTAMEQVVDSFAESIRPVAAGRMAFEEVLEVLAEAPSP